MREHCEIYYFNLTSLFSQIFIHIIYFKKEELLVGYLASSKLLVIKINECQAYY